MNLSEPLWAAAVKVAGTYGIRRTAKVLRVDYYALKKRVEQKAAVAGAQGENFKDVLVQRAADPAPPIRTCDALSRNLPAELQTIVANCPAHGRRGAIRVRTRRRSVCASVVDPICRRP